MSRPDTRTPTQRANARDSYVRDAIGFLERARDQHGVSDDEVDRRIGWAIDSLNDLHDFIKVRPRSKAT